jgi:glycolate oxidase iron-sulfur subunit
MLMGCVQPAMMPNINSATARVLDAAGIQTLVADEAGCSGAIRLHLNDHEGGLDDMRRNIDAWWQSGVEQRGRSDRDERIGLRRHREGIRPALARDPAYADKAKRVSELTRDLSELLSDLVPKVKPKVRLRNVPTQLAFHPPCTLQHGQKLRGGVETNLNALGFDVRVASNESHLCCGSAGTYSVLQPELAYQLRDRKLANVASLDAQTIVSVNIGLHSAPADRHYDAGEALD